MEEPPRNVRVRAGGFSAPPSPLSCCLALFIALLSQEARGQALEVAPVSVEIAGGRATAVLTVTNRSGEPTTVQARPFLWDQSTGDDRLVPTQDLAVSPPFTDLNPGESQIIRLVLRSPPAGAEKAFRIYVDQLPPAAAPGSIRMALRVSIPVFAEPLGAVRARLSWMIVPSPTAPVLVVRNDGDRRLRLSGITLPAPLKLAQQSNAFAYVLAHSQRRLPLLPSTGGLAVGGGYTVRAQSDQGPLSADIRVVASPPA